MSPAGGSDGGDQPRVKRSRFDKPASSKGKAATTGPTATDGATVVTDKAAALERAKKALQLKDLQNSLQSKLAALKVIVQSQHGSCDLGDRVLLCQRGPHNCHQVHPRDSAVCDRPSFPRQLLPHLLHPPQLHSKLLRPHLAFELGLRPTATRSG